MIPLGALAIAMGGAAYLTRRMRGPDAVVVGALWVVAVMLAASWLERTVYP